MKKIPLTQGKFALVDDEDYEWLNQFKWHANNVKTHYWYATRNENGKNIMMHTAIMKPKKGFMVDHVDGNGLNNQRSNLRNCTNQQNLQNRRIHKNNTSGYKGVYWDKQHNKWRADCGRNLIGLFGDKIEAAKAYDKRAVELFGEFAQTNF